MSNSKNALAQEFQEPISVRTEKTAWQHWQLLVFRFLFIFFLFFIVPIDPNYYQRLLHISWSENPFYGLLELTRYQPEFISLKDAEGVPVLGLASYANWIIVFVLAVIGTLIWTIKDKGRTEYNVLFYWLCVVVRYRLAILLFTYGVYKLFLLQIPSASLSNLFTNYGDAYAWKVYYQTTSLSNFYVEFLGFVEILGALLLVFRKSTTWGAGLILGYIGNVAVANSFYDLGDLSLSTFIVLGAAFLFAPQVPRLFQLLIQEKRVFQLSILIDFKSVSWKYYHKIAKITLFAFFALVLFAGFGESQKGFGSYKYPKTPGLENAYGIYDVKEFILDGDTIPYSNIDSTRWQNVIFEKWSTISILNYKPVIIDKTSGENYHSSDLERNYELAGFAGRHYYHYSIDSSSNTLHLINKNRHHRDEEFHLVFQRPNEKTVVLSGKNSEGNDLKVVLEKVEKNYMLFEGRRKAARL
ncbi:DoxX family protein [Sphingobacterium bovistauri]|uniref:DoxX family protein n=1 Tax=Sphingobacterium bovistauri TaxID=2781959 RepID=A0ABS7Z4D1_9SPHI|nr:DoxX family protein [Sphingobacterium bovistauri]MCA5005048.1 DoxX family protein [Sphingobacterium bovistauri]